MTNALPVDDDGTFNPVEHAAQLLSAATGIPTAALEYRACNIFTNGPSLSALHPETGRWLTVAWEPDANTYRVWCKQNSWSGVRPDRVAEALGDVRGGWSDTWTLDREAVAVNR